MIGGIYKRKLKGGGWSYSIRFPDHAGNLHTRTLAGSPSKAEALKQWQAWLSEARAERGGLARRADRTTLHEFWTAEYMPYMVNESGIADSTREKRIELYEDHLRRPLGGMMLGSIDAEVMPATLHRLRAKGGPREGQLLADATKRGLDAVLTRVMHVAAEKGYFGKGVQDDEVRGRWMKPWKSVKRAVSKERHGLMGDADFTRLMQAAYDTPRDPVQGAMLACAITLATCAGHRRGEQRHIMPGLHVRQTSPEEWECEVHITKTKDARLALLRGTTAAVVSHWSEVRDVRLVAAGVDPASVPFFCQLTSRRGDRNGPPIAIGDPYSKYVISDGWWAATKQAAGLPPAFREHDLRGAYAKHLADHLEFHDVQRNMGHKAAATTSIYLKNARSPHVKRAADVMAQIPLPNFLEQRDEPGKGLDS